MSTYAPRSSHAQHAPSPAPDGSGTSTLAVPTGRIACEGCAAIVEARLRTSPHVLGVHVDAAHQVAHVQVHEGTVSAKDLTELVAGACGDRNPVPLPKPDVSSHAHAHTARTACGAIDHATMGRDGGHARHDMSDPRMAAAMEADMRRRFWISLVLALPVLAYSSLATNIFGLRLPTPPGVPADWIMLAFATPVAGPPRAVSLSG